MLCLSLGILLSSFSSRPGGEGFEIYLNNQVLLQRFGKDMNTVKSFALNPGSPNDKLTIKYHHCGQPGKNRVISIKDGQDKLLKEFRYKDTDTRVAEMTLPVKEIFSLQQKGNNTFRVYYRSTELPAGRMLVSLQPKSGVVAKL